MEYLSVRVVVTILRLMSNGDEDVMKAIRISSTAGRVVKNNTSPILQT